VIWVKLLLSLLNNTLNYLHTKRLLGAGSRAALASITLKILDRVEKADEIRDKYSGPDELRNKLLDAIKDKDDTSK